MTTMTLAQLDHTWTAFGERIIKFATRLELINCQLECDHVALRVNDKESAAQISKGLVQRGDLISRNIINGRPIEIIELSRPLRLGEWQIRCVELPYPSDKRYPVQGWEHIELVLPCDALDSESLANALINKVPSLATIIAGKTEVKVKISSPKGDKERLANPTIAFKSEGLCIKVHAHGIKTIIASEQST